MVRKNKPLRAAVSANKSYALFEARLAQYTSPSARLGAAVGYLQAALKRADPGLALQASDEMFEALVAKAQQVEAATVAASERRRAS